MRTVHYNNCNVLYQTCFVYRSKFGTAILLRFYSDIGFYPVGGFLVQAEHYCYVGSK